LFSLLCFVLCLSLFFVLHSMSSVPLDFWVALRFFSNFIQNNEISNFDITRIRLIVMYLQVNT
jgi:hypothetical protein